MKTYFFILVFIVLIQLSLAKPEKNILQRTEEHNKFESFADFFNADEKIIKYDIELKNSLYSGSMVCTLRFTNDIKTESINLKDKTNLLRKLIKNNYQIFHVEESSISKNYSDLISTVEGGNISLVTDGFSNNWYITSKNNKKTLNYELNIRIQDDKRYKTLEDLSNGLFKRFATLNKEIFAKKPTKN